jgi:hypothetical protein
MTYKRFTFQRRTTIAAQQVSIGNRPPNARYIPGFADPAKRFVKPEELYVPKKERR